jgi:hypothetical protein
MFRCSFYYINTTTGRETAETMLKRGDPLEKSMEDIHHRVQT